MSEDYSEDEQEWVDTKFSTSSNGIVPLDMVLSVSEQLQDYTQSIGIPVLDARGAGYALYEHLVSKNG